MSRVLIVQRVLTHYRVPFFEMLREQLADSGVALDLVVGQPTRAASTKQDLARLSWAIEVKNRYVRAGRSKQVVWQPVWRLARRSDLVIVEQASRLLINYLLVTSRRFGGPKVAFWGHGENRDQEAASQVGESLKRRLAPRADWWFCYTAGTARLLSDMGVSGDRMTVVQNAVDVRELQSLRAEVTDDERRALRASLGIGSGPVALALGSIYPSKRPRYLIEAADLVHESSPDFHLIIVGDGPDRPLVDAAAVTRPWLHPVGMLKGKAMVVHASLARLIMNPGLVGLSVLDAFALGLPMITCDLSWHSPEIEYLTSDVNGMVLPSSASPDEFAREVTYLLRSAPDLERLQAGCAVAAGRFSIEAMVSNFSTGVLEALSMPG